MTAATAGLRTIIQAAIRVGRRPQLILETLIIRRLISII